VFQTYLLKNLIKAEMLRNFRLVGN